jgi:hypothetical protein
MRGPTDMRPWRRAWRHLLGIAALGWGMLSGGMAMAQTTGFTLIGHIERFSLDAPRDPLASASMTVRGITVVLPRNLLITLPGRYMTAHDLFLGPGPSQGLQAQSGLALEDSTPPKVPFEAEIIGNVTNGRYVAGVVRISQGALHLGAGYIQAIDSVTGEMRVGDRGGTAGARVRLNDSRGIFAPADPTMDRRFSLDPENSPVHASTGFPVCVQGASNAATCPAGNRPAGDPTRFTCGKEAAPGVDAVHDTCDPRFPVPLRVGDHVTYAGMLVPHPAGGFMVAAHGLNAELGIYTSPNAEIVYVFVEEAIQGSKGEQFPGIPQEETTRFRIVGFTTDPTRNVEVWLVDSDRLRPSPPAGEPPFYGRSFTGPGGLAPSNGPQLGRFRNTWPAKDDARAVRRDVLVRVVSGPWQLQHATGLTSGTYVSPIGEYIYPEPTSFGLRGFPLPVPFENFCFLSVGGGRFSTAGTPDMALGRLDPFPESGHPQSQVIGNGPQRACDGE